MSSKSNKKTHRYNRLMSSSTSLSSSCATPLPKKSVSQPVNLAKCGPTNDNNGNNINDDYLIQPPENVSHISPNHGSLKNSSKSGGKGGDGGNVKHSISSFFPFSSCTFYGIMVKSKSTDCNQSKENKEGKLIISRDNDDTKTVNNEDQSANVQEEQQENNNNKSTIDYWGKLKIFFFLTKKKVMYLIIFFNCWRWGWWWSGASNLWCVHPSFSNN